MDAFRWKALRRPAVLGIVGGLAGTILMDIVMMTTFVMFGERADIFFTMVGEKFGGGAMIGVALHNTIGMTGGLTFALLVSSLPALELNTIKKGFTLGIAAGAITIPLGCIPLAIWLGESIVGVVEFSTLPHLVWGVIVGLTVAYGGSPAAR